MTLYLVYIVKFGIKHVLSVKTGFLLRFTVQIIIIKML